MRSRFVFYTLYANKRSECDFNDVFAANVRREKAQAANKWCQPSFFPIHFCSKMHNSISFLVILIKNKFSFSFFELCFFSFHFALAWSARIAFAVSSCGFCSSLHSARFILKINSHWISQKKYEQLCKMG